MNDIIHVAADTANGVYKIDPVDYPERELSKFEDFMDSLPTLEDDEVVFTAVTEGSPEHEQLESEYGIR